MNLGAKVKELVPTTCRDANLHISLILPPLKYEINVQENKSV